MPSRRRKPVILVTGASQGIGAAIARAFAAEVRGAGLALVARSAEGLALVAKQCAALGARAAVFPCDVTDEGAVAGLEAADFDRIMAANLRSLFLVTRAFAPAMVRRGRGDIFNMGSVAGIAAYPGSPAYTAAKFGVTGLSESMRAEFRGKGVRVCCVFPGPTVSPSWKGSGVPWRRMMPAEDVAAAFIAAYRMTRRTVVEEIVLRPLLGDL